MSQISFSLSKNETAIDKNCIPSCQLCGQGIIQSTWAETCISEFLIVLLEFFLSSKTVCELFSCCYHQKQQSR